MLGSKKRQQTTASQCHLYFLPGLLVGIAVCVLLQDLMKGGAPRLSPNRFPVVARRVDGPSGRAVARQVQPQEGQVALPCPASATATSRRLVIFFGTRPEAIKMAPLLHALGKRVPKGVTGYKAVFTGQHPDLVAPFAKFWNIKIDAHVTGTFVPGQSLPHLSGSLVSGIDTAIPPCPGDVWMVQGDTQSAFAAGLVAFLRGTPTVHVEAGLRTFDMRSPFPEEFNRRALGMVATMHAAPTNLSRENLIGQGVSPSRVLVTGNTGIDAARLAEPNIQQPKALPPGLTTKSRMLLVTMHRRENREHMTAYYDAIANASACADAAVIISVHPNPAATAAARAACGTHNHFHCVDPLDYGESQWMLKHAIAAVTDSGGLQEEATWYSTPSLVLRKSTERPEAVFAGTSLIAADPAVLVESLQELCKPVGAGATPSNLTVRMRRAVKPFGDGHAADRILATVAAAPWLYVNASTEPTHPMRPVHKLLPRMCTKEAGYREGWEECSAPGTVTAVLTVYARPFFGRQLAELAAQTMKPRNILVVQSGAHAFEVTNVTEEIAAFRIKHPAIPVHHVHLGVNGWYHTRFFLAHALSDAEYVAVFDDDVAFTPKTLEAYTSESARKGGALITANGRSFVGITLHPSGEVEVHQNSQCFHGYTPVDFGGHLWVMPRDNLRHFFAMPQLTRRSAEDVQLSFALSQHGIETYCAETGAVNNIPQSQREGQSMKVASWKSGRQQIVRRLAFCEVMLMGMNLTRGFRPRVKDLRACIKYHKMRIGMMPDFTEKRAHEF
mmetsp:Transcript_13458/g.34516  ORF Transcript_13458/g.34516 Transcript_13458/m.34516 type:complete len:784 (-) Transcript_13458:339-2690(-)|eukprot:CAMPEP_0182921628 /NCGR_PEP_ID=MMETSP0105_2-20130417/4260_1 /TAXON_ID=81532 ORGANISM="Acanthoeca-like sp., Strain 10tr" /NCGR_SAMPLE_ID=MMETSP0105_2 /ASSEMBLY_ACC=CAM_ASM_000205 /LENGTH=783 /DNA_ID=CAMNT_0025059159 /DNA_START=171 /DNA_END=2522 /DNA_ORIENTATION=+